MKRNMLAIIILAVSVVNLAMSAFMMLTVMNTNSKALKLISDVAAAVNIDNATIKPAKGGGGGGTVSMDKTAIYDIKGDNKLTIPLAAGSDGSTHYVQLEIALSMDIDNPAFTCDKFVIWYKEDSQLNEIRKFTDKYYDCIDRGGTFREFVPKGYSKATGLQKVLDYYNLPLDSAYAFGDSNNDLAMLSYVKHSVVMGNAESEDLKEKAVHLAGKASEDGLAKALSDLGFFE